MTPKELKSGEETLTKHISQALTEMQKSNADGLILTEWKPSLQWTHSTCSDHGPSLSKVFPHVYPKRDLLGLLSWLHEAPVTRYPVLNKNKDPPWDILLNVFRCWILPLRINMHLKNTHTPYTLPFCEEIWARHELTFKSKAFHCQSWSISKAQ